MLKINSSLFNGTKNGGIYSLECQDNRIYHQAVYYCRSQKIMYPNYNA